MTNKLEYAHLKVNEDVTTIAGYYTPLKEVRLKYNGKEVLYVVGRAVIESSCCGVGHWGYVQVPGYVINWQNRANETGKPVSDIEPISDKTAREAISRIIREAESIPQIELW
jgi:hypothetical protein